MNLIDDLMWSRCSCSDPDMIRRREPLGFQLCLTLDVVSRDAVLLTHLQ